jgi:hypothetical protein
MRIAPRSLCLFVLMMTAVSLVAVGCGQLDGPALQHLSPGKVFITHPLANRTAIAGHPTTFKVQAKGRWPVRYQWLRNGAEIDGATAQQYTISKTAIEDAGARFQVRVSSWGITKFSTLASLKLTPPKLAWSVSFPVRKSANGRYLVDAKGQPFRIQGEAAWSLIANLTYAEAEAYLDNRREKGFNTVLVELMEHKYAQAGNGAKFTGVPTNRAGVLPFLKNEKGGVYDGTWGTADFSSPNEAYFAFGDSIIDLAARKEMLVNLAPIFLGFNGNEAGWWADLTNSVNTPAVAYNFGRYIGNRYKDRKNIIWVIGGDYTPATGSEGEARLLSLLRGVKAAGATQLWSGDWKASSLSVDEAEFASVMDLNAVYTYGVLGHVGATYVQARAAFDSSPVLPAYLKETGYEDERISPGDGASVRMYQYYAILGGSTAGGFFGNRDVWKFGTDRWWFDPDDTGHGPWVPAMESPGSFDFFHLGELLDSLPWYDLVPSGLSGTKALVQAGRGNHGTTDYVIATATRDGRTLLAYVPSTRPPGTSFTVDMSALGGPCLASWFDPGSGAYTQVPGAPFPNTGSKAFVTPGLNAAGDADWVLVLQAKQ